MDQGINSRHKFLRSLAGQVQDIPPIWMMRQAGRYLPEYREIRARARDFIDFCYTPSLACEASLQPIRRFGFDAAILFADILLILDVLGRDLKFVENEGPRLNPIETASELEVVSQAQAISRLSPVFETVERLSAALKDTTPVIGFAGSPWTVAVYAIEGKGGTDKQLSRLWAHQRPEELDRVIDIITHITSAYLKAQVDAGAQCLMLFDSWAEGLPDNIFEQIIIRPTRTLVSDLRALGVTCPIIGFPRGAGSMLGQYAKKTGVSAVGIDTSVAGDFVTQVIPFNMAVQGNLDPLCLMAGGQAMDNRIDQILSHYIERPFVMNLGHGILPKTPIAHVNQMIDRVRKFRG